MNQNELAKLCGISPETHPECYQTRISDSAKVLRVPPVGSLWWLPYLIKSDGFGTLISVGDFYEAEVWCGKRGWGEAKCPAKAIITAYERCYAHA